MSESVASRTGRPYPAFVSVDSGDVTLSTCHNLPVATSRFVGRESECRQVGELLAASRLVTLIGAGGVGKTRLALEVANILLTAFSDGAYFVDLAPLRDPALVAPQLNAVLGLAGGGEEGTADALVDRIADHLARRHVLVVFDNCEHLLDAVRPLVDLLLRRCPPLSVLATSRDSLRIAGETVWRLPSLSLPPNDSASPIELLARSDAVGLFCERARSVQPGFRLDAHNALDIAQLCRRLDGIPLALELAAAQLHVCDPGRMAAGVDERLEFLAGGSGTAPTRHQTLRACMDWGFELLGPMERVVLRRLAAFPGDFDFPAAQRIAGDEEAVTAAMVRDALDRLVDASWVTATGPDGNRLRLTETVRRYAAERLFDIGEDEVVRRRHRDHFLSVAAEFRGPALGAGRRWLTRVGTEYENLRAALEWSWQRGESEQCLVVAGHLYPYWSLDGRFLEGRLWLERALALDPDARGAAHVWGLGGLGLLLAQLNEMDRALALWRRARDLAVASHDVAGEAHALAYLGVVSFRRLDHDVAEELLLEAGEKFAASGLPVCIGCSDFNHGWIALARSDRSRAADDFASALRIGRQHGSEILVIHALAALASLAALDGDTDRALALSDEAVVTARGLGLRHVLAMALTRAAETALLGDKRAKAESRLRESLRMIRQLGGRMWVTDGLQLAGLVLEAGGHAEMATRLLAAAGGLAAGPVPEGPHRPLHDAVQACRARLGERLDPMAFDAERRVGRALSAEAALDEALAALDPEWAPWVSSQREARTFMFTDIVGSTALAESLGDDAWSNLLRWHDEILRSLFSAHGGEEIKHTGDGFFVAFQRADDALGCAVAVQEALASHGTNAGVGPRVRIGLHETEATRRGHDYHGKGVHEAARIAALADADQILASRPTLAASRKWNVYAPRRVQLKGLSRPVEIVAIDWDSANEDHSPW
jgi:predicted ATPase/class 3 adenylate cyclase